MRAWTIHENTHAPIAGGTIHSDIERGYIRAEVIKYDDYLEFKSENAVKAAGKMPAQLAEDIRSLLYNEI